MDGSAAEWYTTPDRGDSILDAEIAVDTGLRLLSLHRHRELGAHADRPTLDLAS